MANVLDPVKARLAAILGGTYPASAAPPNRQIAPGTFAPGSYFIPAENPLFPRIKVDRQWETQWSTAEYDAGGAGAADPGAENQSQGPHVWRFGVTLRVSYNLVKQPALAPTTGELAMGALETVSRRAQNDALVILWALGWYPNWAGTPIVYLRRSDKVTVVKKGNGLTVEAVLPLHVGVLVADPGANPGLGT